MEGDPSKTVGARVLLALARVLEVLLLDLRRPGSAVRPYVDVVLRCLVTLFLGEEGSLADRVRTYCSEISRPDHIRLRSCGTASEKMKVWELFGAPQPPLLVVIAASIKYSCQCFSA